EYSKKIVGPFKFGKYQKLESSKKSKKDINKYKVDEHEEDENKFHNMIWDIELCVGKDKIKKTIEESKKFNQGTKGEHIADDDNLYWHKNFLEFKKQYIRDFFKKNLMIKVSSSSSKRTLKE
ncbi:23718_t:CDS:2, partial [Gigaspora margarita]